MSSNTDKCVVLRQHPRHARDREHLRSVSHQRDLGVIVDETLKPHRQSTKAAKSANSIMRAIKASFMNTPTLFISYMAAVAKKGVVIIYYNIFLPLLLTLLSDNLLY